MKYFKLEMILLALALLISPVLQAEDAYEVDWIDQYGTSIYDTSGYRSDHGKSVATDSNGNIYVTGDVGASLDGETYNGGTADMFISKYDATGTRLWSRLLGSSSDNYYNRDYGKSIAIDSNDNIYVGGWTSGILPGQTSDDNQNGDGFLVKYNTGGQLIWTRQFGMIGFVDVNGADVEVETTDQVEAVTTDASGNIYVTGRSYRGTTVNDQVFIKKFDAEGVELWGRQLSSLNPHPAIVDQVTSITADSYGDVYVAGYTGDVFPNVSVNDNNINIGRTDAFLAKYDAEGNAVWIKQFGKTQLDYALSVTVGDNGNLTTGTAENIYVAGYYLDSYETDAFLIAYSQDGTEVWSKEFGANQINDRGLEVARSVSTDDSGNIYVAGSTTGGWIYDTWGYLIRFYGYSDVYVVKFDNSGEFIWYTGFGASYVDTAESITVDNSGNLYVVGTTESILALPTSYDKSPGYDDIFLTKLAAPAATNIAPFADAGQDQVLTLIGSTVTLDGGGSYDDDGDDISYDWEIVKKPDGSSAVLDDPSVATPTFIADVNRVYQIVLTVTDSWDAATTDDVMVSFSNVAPVADAGANQSTAVGEMVLLNGGGSSDANGDEITFSWSLSTVPSLSLAVISDATIEAPSFTPDVSGTYIASLVVNDGIIDSAADTSEIVVVEVITTATEAVSETIALINDIPVENFRNVNLSNALTNKLNAVLKMITNEQYEQALNKLTTDILPKTDGCALYGISDKKDWIETCEEQEPVYNYILETIELLETML